MIENYTDETISTSDKIYSLLARRLEETGDSLPCTMEALRIYASSPRSDIDCLKLVNLDNQSFFDAAYLIATSNIPSDEYTDMWLERIKSLPEEQFQHDFVTAFVYWPEFSMYHVRLRNCICMDVSASSRIRIQTAAFIRKFMFCIYRTLKPVYLRFPKKVKDTLKHHFRKYVFG